MPEILAHWHVPSDYGTSIFWAMLRKQENYWDSSVLPEAICFDDFQAVLLKVLRRCRDKYCGNKLGKNQFVMQNHKSIEDEYILGDSCGKGAFGECFWVTHRMSTNKDKRVCKKIPKEESTIPAEEIPSELNTLKLLDHPHIVRVFEWFESQDSYFIVLEAAHGGDIKKFLAKTQEEQGRRGIEERMVNDFTSQALRAVAYIHSMHIIHRDIKPGNMLLAKADVSRPRLLLADFGVSELYERSLSLSPQMRGTVAYMAPEVFTSELSPRSDIWALGIVVYELLCGLRPFAAENAMAMYLAVSRSPVNCEPLGEVEASEQAIAFILRLLAKVQTERPSAMEAFGDPWIANGSTNIPLPVGRLARKLRRTLTEYAECSHFSKAAMNCIAAQLDTSRIEGLTEVFESLDRDCDGKLSIAELAAGLAELGVDPDAIGQLVDALDTNRDGEIQFSEFIASLLRTQSKLIEEVIFQAFHVIDVNHDGVVSLDELRLMLSGDGPLTAILPDGKTVEQVLSQVDTSQDGKISFDEFKAFLMRDVQGGPEVELFMPSPYSAQPTEPMEALLRSLAVAVGRPEEELGRQAARLTETHWITTVGDLIALAPEDWPRLGLPLKLERLLRERLSS